MPRQMHSFILALSNFGAHARNHEFPAKLWIVVVPFQSGDRRIITAPGKVQQIVNTHFSWMYDGCDTITKKTSFDSQPSTQAHNDHEDSGAAPVSMVCPCSSQAEPLCLFRHLKNSCDCHGKSCCDLKSSVSHKDHVLKRPGTCLPNGGVAMQFHSAFVNPIYRDLFDLPSIDYVALCLAPTPRRRPRC